MAIVMETERLILRQFTPHDLPLLVELYTDPEVVKHVGPGTPLPMEQIERILQCALIDEKYAWSDETLERVPQLLRARERNACFSLWATFEKRTNQFVGRCGLLSWDLDGQKEVEVGYILTKRAWGQGFATEAARASRDYGMDVLGFDRLISVIKPENLASQRVAIKNGMRHERDTMVKEWPVRIYAIDRDQRDVFKMS
ncbi:MAG TPA: GNAT family N-acetyltransferase [Tepidisphaeraceae bacterium]|jgi:ribosomal-protein-alanine N-acetyltransferase